MKLLSRAWKGILEAGSDLWFDHGGKVKMFLTFFVTMAAIGFFVGRYQSPDYRDDTALQNYVARKSHKSALKDQLLDGPYLLTYICDAREFKYFSFNKDKVDVSVIPESLRIPSARRTTTFTDALLLLAGGLKGDLFKLKEVSVAAWRDLPAKQRAAQGIFLSVAAGSGFGVGYYYGYDEQLDCKDGSVQKNLTDPAFWQAVEADVRAATREVHARQASATR